MSIERTYPAETMSREQLISQLVDHFACMAMTEPVVLSGKGDRLGKTNLYYYFPVWQSRNGGGRTGSRHGG